MIDFNSWKGTKMSKTEMIGWLCIGALIFGELVCVMAFFG